MPKLKLKWFREGYDPHEDMYLIPVGQERTEDDDLNTDVAVAWIKIAYDRTRFYSGRGGEGTSRPDAYVAFVQDRRPGRQLHGSVIPDRADAVAHIGGLFSDKSDKAFTSLRAAKQAIMTELIMTELVKLDGAAIETTAEATRPATDVDVDVDAPSAPCTHPEHRLGTRGGLRKHQRVCLQCGAVVLAPRRGR